MSRKRGTESRDDMVAEPLPADIPAAADDVIEAEDLSEQGDSDMEVTDFQSKKMVKPEFSALTPAEMTVKGFSFVSFVNCCRLENVKFGRSLFRLTDTVNFENCG